MNKVAILHPADPLGHVPSGIDTFIRGILKWAPQDIHYTLIGATSDPTKHPLGLRQSITLGSVPVDFIPVATVDPDAKRSRVPLTLRYLWGLWRQIRSGALDDVDILDVHRIEPLMLIRQHPASKNVFLHQDMAVIRQPGSDILWSHAPKLYERLERALLKEADAIFCVRESAVARYQKLYPEISQRFRFTPTWVDPETFRPSLNTIDRREDLEWAREKLGLSVGTPLIVTVGRLDHQKDPLLLLEAFGLFKASHPEAQLVYVGNGALGETVRQRARDLQLDPHVVFAGSLHPNLIARLLRAADLFALSSAYEGMPIALLEALASGLPAASTDVGEVRRVIAHRENGAISKGRRSADLCEAMTQALEIPTQRARSASLDATRPYHAEAILSQIQARHRRV